MNTIISKTPYGETELYTIGQGPKLLVLHGGPGFTHNYLVEPLKDLSSNYTLIFYNQPSFDDAKKSGEKFTPSYIYRHFRWLSHHLSEKEEPINIIAHSWGCLVFLASQADKNLSNEPICRFDKTLLINPVPVTAKKFSLTSQNLIKRLSFMDRLKLTYWTISKKEGSEIMKALLPFYVNDPSTIPEEDMPLDKQSYLKLIAQLKKFDYSKSLPNIPHLKLLCCEQDFISFDLLDDLTQTYPVIETIKNSGHYPFWEKKTEFNRIIHSFF